MLLHHILTSIKDLFKESGVLPSYKIREKLAKRYLHGTGLEIGALHLPLKVPADVHVKYVDVVSREENISRFPNLRADRVVDTDYIENGFELFSIPDHSYDFIIANHVLEHAPNPLQVLSNWGRILSQGGILFVTVPLAEKCFDKYRPLTSLDHFITDYSMCRNGDYSGFAQNNRIHYREWLTLSMPNISKESRIGFTPFSAEELAMHIDGMVNTQSEIHFHTFSEESFVQLLHYFISAIESRFKILEVLKSRGNRECVAVLSLG